MKKILYSTLFVISFTYTATVQCNPDPQYTTIGFHPDTLTGLPVACENLLYDQTITIVVPSDTTLNIPPFGPITIPLDSIILGTVTGLPAGITTECQTPSCTIYPQTSSASCLKLTGTPAPGSSGTYTLLIPYTAHVTVLGSPTSLNLQQSYPMEVQDCASIDELKLKNIELVKITDLTGREIEPKIGIPVLYHFSDGSVRKTIILED